MKYRINYEELLKCGESIGTLSEATEEINNCRNMIRAIFCLLDAGEFSLTEESYKKLGEWKKYFIGE